MLIPVVYIFRSRGLTREVNKIERNVVTCYLYGSAFAGKSAFVDAFVERKGPAPTADGDDEETILRAISAVIDKDATKYLLVRTYIVLKFINVCALCTLRGLIGD